MQISRLPPLLSLAPTRPSPVTAQKKPATGTDLVERVVQGELVEEGSDFGEWLRRGRMQTTRAAPASAPVKQALACYQANAAPASGSSSTELDTYA